MRILVAALVLCAGCSGSSSLPGLGESCSVLCAPGLDCSPSHFCIKHCRCDGGAICSPSSLASGCPTRAACVAADEAGAGMCAALCADGNCPPGEASCAAAPDGTPVCVGPSYPWFGVDGGSDQSAAHD